MDVNIFFVQDNIFWLHIFVFYSLFSSLSWSNFFFLLLCVSHFFTHTMKFNPFSLCCPLCMWQIDLKGDVNTAVVTDLTPKTDYSLTVYAIYPSLIGDSATVTVQTSGCHAHTYTPVQRHTCIYIACTLWTFIYFEMYCTFLPWEAHVLVFQLLCLRSQTSVSLKRACSLCVWPGRLL